MLTVPLTRPIIVKGETVNSLTFREPDMGDLIAGETIGKGVQSATILATLASMAGITFLEAKKISPVDFKRIDAEVAPLLGNDSADEDGTK